jgi:hypothetical protein
MDQASKQLTHPCTHSNGSNIQCHRVFEYILSVNLFSVVHSVAERSAAVEHLKLSKARSSSDKAFGLTEYRKAV